MNPTSLYLLHFANVNKFYDTCVDKKEELASRIPGCATIKNRFLLNCLWYVMVFIEPILSLVLVTFYMPFFLFKVIFRKRKPFTYKHIGLGFAGLARQRIRAVTEVYDNVDYYLYPINVDEVWVMPDKERHNVLEIVSAWEVLKAYFWSLITIVVATFKTHGKYLYRNSLCYEYLLTNYYLRRIPEDCTLYFVNHLDRWAVLFNLAPQKEKVLLQHGIEGADADWPVKLTNVTKAYIFANSQKERMKNAVLGHEPVFVEMPPTISLTDMSSALQKNIVIVACDNYRFYDKEEYIIKRIIRKDIRIYIKIHPGKNDDQKYMEVKKSINDNIEIINTPTFPKVDAVISYKSTLGLEYEALNIPVFYYEDMSLDDIVKHINAL